MSLDLIKKKSPLSFNSFPNTVKPLTEGLYLMPNMCFTCSGSVKRLLIAAKIDQFGEHESQPSFQVWRPLTNSHNKSFDNQVVSLISNCSINISETYFSPDGYFYYKCNKAVEFIAGDFIGFYQPSNKTVTRLFYSTETFRPPQTIFVGSSFHNSSPESNLSIDTLQANNKISLLLLPETSKFHTTCTYMLY